MFADQNMLIEGGDLSLSAPPKRVAVIGCGAAGLVSMKTVLEYGHMVVGFERLSDIGGLWNFKECGSDASFDDAPDPDVPYYPSYASLVTNTSKYNTMFSDFPPLKGTGDFLRHDQLCRYLKSYADHFSLRSHIKFNSHVLKVDKTAAKWHVTYTVEDKTTTDIFDFVMICTGAFEYPYRPSIHGMNTFTGLMLHSGQINNGQLFKDKRVLIIGGGYSGAEMITMAIQNGVRKLHVSATHRPEVKSAWCIDRYVKSIYGGDKQMPWDQNMNRENAIENNPDFGFMFAQWCYPFHKSHKGAFLNYPSDSLAVIDLNMLRSAKQNKILDFVEPIVQLERKTALLKNGSQLSDVDVVILATGYERRFPFLDHIWSSSEQKKCELYNYVISPKPELDGLAFILMTPSNSFFSYAEMQARWFAHKIVSRRYSPQTGCILNDTERQHMVETIVEKKTQRDGIDVPFNLIEDSNILVDHFAKDIGVQPPNYKDLIATGRDKDVELGVALAYGPICSMQYRIRGHGVWPKAVDECIALAKGTMGDYFELFKEKVRKNEYPRSALFDKLNSTKSKY